MKHPYYIIPDIEALKSTEGEEHLFHARRIAVAIDDQAVLRAILNLDPQEFADFYPTSPATPDTDDTINSFLDHFGKSVHGSTVEEIIGVPAIDYAAAVLDRQPAHTETSEPEPEKPEATAGAHTPEPAAENESLSESFAKLMIKNGNYRKALEIITASSLNNPKKSIYFADQIRFLKKLIANQNDNNSKTE